MPWVINDSTPLSFGIQFNGAGDVNFDGPAKVIIIGFGITVIAVTEIYSRWKDWVLDNPEFLEAISILGGDPISAEQSVGFTYFLENGWKIRSWEDDHNLEVTGNLFTRDGSSPFIPTVGQYRVQITLKTSNIVDLIIAAGADANSVWSVLLTSILTADSIGEHVKDKILTQNKFLALKD